MLVQMLTATPRFNRLHRRDYGTEVASAPVWRDQRRFLMISAHLT
jgi:hypothetical protein